MSQSPDQSTDQIKKEFESKFHALTYHKDRWQVWNDWTEIATISIANPAQQDEELSNQYTKIISRYKNKEIEYMNCMINLTSIYLNKKMDDFLGKVYMELDLGSKGHAQFFTPYTISKMTAKMTLSSNQFENNKTLTMGEPAAGSGGMAIAACDTLQEYNIDYKKQLRIIAQDINWNAVKMTYIQLSSINAQAHVVYGNTITHEEIAKYCTPEAIKSNWK